MRAVLLTVLALASGCGKRDEGGDRSSDVVDLRGDRLTEFVDHTERFKGRTLRAELYVQSVISAARGDSLREYAGRPVEFRASGRRGENLRVVINMPTAGLPNATYNDRLLVTFICRGGTLASGNDATTVSRP